MKYYLCPDSICDWNMLPPLMYPLGRNFPTLPVGSYITLPAPQGWSASNLDFWIEHYAATLARARVAVVVETHDLPEKMSAEEYDDLLCRGWVMNIGDEE